MVVKHVCVVYDSDGVELFRQKGNDLAGVAYDAAKIVREDYPLQSVSWQFEKIYPPVVEYELSKDLPEWDEYVQARRAEIFGVPG